MPSSNPILSVIMPAYNAANYIRQAIDSILQQTFSDFELLIADDGSLDNTQKIIDSYNDARIIKDHNATNQGKVKTANRLAFVARGEFLTIHDADDFSEPDRFETIHSFFQENPHISMVGSSFFEVTGKKRKLVEMPTDFSEIRKSMPYTSQFHGPTLVFKREILKDTHGLFRYFLWGEDVDFAARVIEKFEATNINLPLYNYRIHDKSLTKNVDVVSPDRMVNQKLRVFLADQRKRTGTDCLIDNQPEILEEERQRLVKVYASDPSRVYWEHSQKMVYYGLKRGAIKSAFKACKIKPSAKNVKNLFAVFVKALAF